MADSFGSAIFLGNERIIIMNKIDNVIEEIDYLVEQIYDPDQSNLVKGFQQLIEALFQCITEMGQLGYNIQIDEELLTMQSCFERKDYTALADFLLYDMKKSFACLKEEVLQF